MGGNGTPEHPRARAARGDPNKVREEDLSAHDWYRFVLSYPPHLVRAYVERFGLDSDHTILDPFCGTGTTLVEAKKLGIPSVGIEPNPMALFASRVKVDWTPDPDALLSHAQRVARAARERLAKDGFEDSGDLASRPGPSGPSTPKGLPPEAWQILLADSISPVPLHKTLTLLETLDAQRDTRFWDHERLALAKSTVFTASNLKFGPEVGVTAPKDDAPVLAGWLNGVATMADDLRVLQASARTRATVLKGDSRSLVGLLEPESVDAVITSPPYPNEKDYTRTTRLENVLLGFIKNKTDLRAVKHDLVRSNTRNVYKSDTDDAFVARHPEITRIAESIEARRMELGKTSGFERLYARATRLYFGGMTRHLADLRRALRPGAQLAYVVGDQASYLQVMIRTGELLADIAQDLGYEVVGIDLFRTRLATATKKQLREEVVVLRWPGGAR